MTSMTTATVDIRQLGACVDRKAAVLAAFDALAVGGSLVVVNDHMPNGLLRHFEEHRPAAFGWEVIQAGPTTFRVEITRKS